MPGKGMNQTFLSRYPPGSIRLLKRRSDHARSAHAARTSSDLGQEISKKKSHGLSD